MIDYSEKIIGIVRATSAKEASELAQALIDAGVKNLELTMTIPDSLSVVEKFAGTSGVVVGLGTVLNVADVARAKNAGAQFIVAPSMSVDVVRETKHLGLYSMPGVATATEVADAIASGADALKLFPASTYGASHLKSLRDPFPGNIWVATGGVRIDSVGEWIKAGVSAFGIGGPLTSGGTTEVAERVKAFKEAITQATL
jgi:2-dehydro-3-deoxyphosphogluconate aldolase/(4S)-4-hydroxy-2-oxoglutarate aldolase